MPMSDSLRNSMQPPTQTQWPSQNGTMKCSCLNNITNICCQIPASDNVAFESILHINSLIVEQWKQANRCGNCTRNTQVISTLEKASEKLANLYEAASQAYGTNAMLTGGEEVYRKPGLSILDWLMTDDFAWTVRSRCLSLIEAPAAIDMTCTRSQMSLGRLALEHDEANILARQVISSNLAGLCSMLKELQDENEETTQSLPNNLLRNPSANDAHHIVQRLLRILGRVRAYQD